MNRANTNSSAFTKNDKLKRFKFFGSKVCNVLNLTEDYLVLRDIAQSLDTTLYVLWEMDARFGEEMKPLNELLDKAVWDTDQDNPTKEWYKKKMDNKYKEMQMKGNDI